MRLSKPTKYRVMPLVLAVTLLAGCGSDDPEVTSVPTTQESATEPAQTASDEATQVATTEPDTALQPAEVALDSSIFWGQHRYDLGTATLTPETGGGTLRVDVLVENLSDEAATPRGSDVWLALNDLASGYSSNNFDATPPKAKVAGNLEFFVDEQFEMDSAVLHFGELTENDSTVPLNGDTVSTAEAQQIDPPAAGSNAKWTITPSAVTLHPQDMWSGYPVEQGQAFMVVDVVATLNETDTRPLHIGTSDFSLTLPDGTSAPAPGGGYPGINEVVDGGQSTPEVSMAFTVPLDAAGDYVLTYLPADDPIEMPFTVE